MTKQKFELPPLPYDFADLEPVISKEIMQLHHQKHHNAYVNNLNAALEKASEAESKGDLSTMISLQGAIRFNGGGHLNHSIFWTNLLPEKSGGGALQNGPLLEAIKKEFGSLDSLIEKMSFMATTLQGSGWAWLGFNKNLKRLVLTTCNNQDPLINQGYIPLLGIDVWEHAYYLQYKNVRADYVKNIWKIVNWKNVEERYIIASG